MTIIEPSPAGLRAAIAAQNATIAALTRERDEENRKVHDLLDTLQASAHWRTKLRLEAERDAARRECAVLRAALVLAVAWLPSEYAVATAEARAELQGIRAALTREGGDD